MSTNKVRLSIDGKTSIDSNWLKGTDHDIVIGSNLYVNPDGYLTGAKIIEIPDHPKKEQYLFRDFMRPYIPPMLYSFPSLRDQILEDMVNQKLRTTWWGY